MAQERSACTIVPRMDKLCMAYESEFAHGSRPFIDVVLAPSSGSPATALRVVEDPAESDFVTAYPLIDAQGPTSR